MIACKKMPHNGLSGILTVLWRDKDNLYAILAYIFFIMIKEGREKQPGRLLTSSNLFDFEEIRRKKQKE